MKGSRLWDVLALLLVITGGAAMVAEIELLDGGRPPSDAGLILLTSGIAVLGGTSDGKRIMNVGFVGALTGFALVLLGGFLRFDGLIYLGTAVMVVSGIILFIIHSVPEHEENAEVS